MAFRDLLEMRDGSLMSWAFHVGSDSVDSKRIKAIRTLLTQPGICYSVDEVTLRDAGHVMEEEFRRMQHEIHEVRKRGFDSYLQELSEVRNRVVEERGRVYRFKVLLDSSVLKEKEIHNLVWSVDELGRL